MNIYNSFELFKALKTIISLPNEVVELSLNMPVDQLPKIELVLNVEKRNNDEIQELILETKKFRIIPDDIENEYMQGLEELAERILKYDWTDNDTDAVKTIEDMRLYLNSLKILRGD